MEYIAKKGKSAIEGADLHTDDEHTCLRRFMEGLLLLYFSDSHHSYATTDCEWFMRLSNEQLSFVQTENTHSVSRMSCSVFQFVLSNILGEPKKMEDAGNISGQTKASNFLNLFDVQV